MQLIGQLSMLSMFEDFISFMVAFLTKFFLLICN